METDTETHNQETSIGPFLFEVGNLSEDRERKNAETRVVEDTRRTWPTVSTEEGS